MLGVLDAVSDLHMSGSEDWPSAIQTLPSTYLFEVCGLVGSSARGRLVGGHSAPRSFGGPWLRALNAYLDAALILESAKQLLLLLFQGLRERDLAVPRSACALFPNASWLGSARSLGFPGLCWSPPSHITAAASLGFLRPTCFVPRI